MKGGGVALAQARAPAELKHIIQRREQKATAIPRVVANEKG